MNVWRGGGLTGFAGGGGFCVGFLGLKAGGRRGDRRSFDCVSRDKAARDFAQDDNIVGSSKGCLVQDDNFHLQTPVGLDVVGVRSLGAMG